MYTLPSYTLFFSFRFLTVAIVSPKNAASDGAVSFAAKRIRTFYAAQNGRRGQRFRLRLFLVGDRLLFAFACARIRARALSAYRKPAPVTQSAVAADIHKPL